MYSFRLQARFQCIVNGEHPLGGRHLFVPEPEIRIVGLRIGDARHRPGPSVPIGDLDALRHQSSFRRNFRMVDVDDIAVVHRASII
jgi:hypothetical protein